MMIVDSLSETVIFKARIEGGDGDRNVYRKKRRLGICKPKGKHAEVGKILVCLNSVRRMAGHAD